MSIESRPNWVRRENIDITVEDDHLDIKMFGCYHIRLYFENPFLDTAHCDGGGGYGMDDLMYDYYIMRHRDDIIKLSGC